MDVAVLEAELASARWNLEQANEQVEALRGRPVTELEAMVFSLRAQLGDAIEGAPTARPRPPASTVIKVARDRGVPTAPDVTAQRQRAVEDGPCRPERPATWQAARAEHPRPVRYRTPEHHHLVPDCSRTHVPVHRAPRPPAALTSDRCRAT